MVIFFSLFQEPLIYLIEQLPGTKNCSRYSFQYHNCSSRNESDEDDEEVCTDFLKHFSLNFVIGFDLGTRFY